jgi:transcriptional regulator with XRE-family HTH domain
MKGFQLKKARKKLQLTQSEIAQKLGVTQSYFSRLEKGERPLSDKLARKAVNLFNLSPTVLPMKTDLKSLRPATNGNFVKELAALNYPSYSHVKPSTLKNPVRVLATALCADNLEGRLVEALPWILLKFSDMHWRELVDIAKRKDLQNRLGFLTSLARKLAEKHGDTKTVAKFKRREELLDRSRLAKEDTLCREKMTEAEKRWVLQNRSAEAAHWNILSNLSVDYLNYAE